MLLVFIDETQDSKFKDYFGLCCVVINSNHYQKIKKDFQSILNKSEWDTKEEFKGSYIFSSRQGCKNVTIEERIDIASKIIELNTSKKNAKMTINYAKINDKDVKEVYLELLPKLLDRSIKKPPKKNHAGKNIIAVYCDQRSDISKEEIFNKIKDIINKKNYTLLEDIVSVKSCFETVGILYADIIGYLMARIDTISNDKELFENISDNDLEYNKNGKIKKLESSKKLIEKIKKSNFYEAERKED